MNSKNRRRAYTLAILCLFAFTEALYAQETKTITIDGTDVVYTGEYEDVPGTRSYYRDDSLVLSVSDTDNNSSPDVWVLYGAELEVIKELRDSDNDGVHDVIFTFNQDEVLQNADGEGLEQYAVPEPVPEQTNVAQNENEVDYAGDLENIQKLAGEGGGGLVWWIVGIIFLAIGIVWYRRRTT